MFHRGSTRSLLIRLCSTPSPASAARDASWWHHRAPAKATRACAAGGNLKASGKTLAIDTCDRTVHSIIVLLYHQYQYPSSDCYGSCCCYYIVVRRIVHVSLFLGLKGAAGPILR